MMSKKTLNLSILGTVLITLIGGIFFLLQSNQNLQASLTEAQRNQWETSQELKALQAELETLKNDKTEAATFSNLNANAQSLTPAEENPPALENTPTPPSPPPPLSPVIVPQLTALPEIADLGTISKKNGPAKAKFELKNTGSLDLDLNYAFSSCGCTVTPLKEKKTLKPGESYSMEVTYDPNYYGPQYELGTIEKTITILSNDPKNAFYKVKLKANIIP